MATRGAGPTEYTRARDRRRERCFTSSRHPQRALSIPVVVVECPGLAYWTYGRLRRRRGHLTVPERVHRKLLRVRHCRCVLRPVPAHPVRLTAVSRFRPFTALLAFEYFITLSQEVELFWKRRVTGASVLFFFNRYLILISWFFNGFTIITNDLVRLSYRRYDFMGRG